MIQTNSISKILKAPKQPFQRVAFYGPMAVGKSWCAEELKWGQYYRFSLAAKIKSLCYELYGINDKSDSSRKVLQDVGLDLRKHDADVWIKYLLKNIAASHEKDRVVVDDLRFKNEAEWFIKNGFILVLVTADEQTRQQRLERLYPNMNPYRLVHASEKEWVDIEPDFTIDSTGPDAATQIEKMLSDATYRPRWQR